MTSKTAKPGRPAGSANKAYAEAVEIPASCPRCKSTKLTAVKGAKRVDHPEARGRIPHGQGWYHGMTRTRKRCECGQLLIVKRYIACAPPAPPVLKAHQRPKPAPAPAEN